MLLHHLWRILDRVTRLFVRACQLEDMGCQHVPDIVGSMRQ